MDNSVTAAMPNLVEILREIEARWGTRTGLAFALLASGIVLIWLFGTVDLSKINRWHVLAVLAAWGLITAAWYRAAIPRAPRSKLGFGIAIRYENPNAETTIRSDFTATLRELVQGSDYLRRRFHFIEFNDRIARRFVESDNPTQLATRANATFVLLGTAKSRVLPDGPSFVLDLRGLVRHAPFDSDLQRRFGADFVAALPRRLIVAEQVSLLAFEFAARHIDVVARYVIGTAAALSGDLPYAEQLLLDAKARLDALARHGGDALLAPMRSKIPVRLGELYEDLLNLAVRRYTLKRERAALADAERVIAQRRRCELPDTYNTLMCAAMCAFLRHRDMDGARRELAACKNVDDCSWRYSEAFLAAYEGDLDSAYRWYRAAFQAPMRDTTIPIQCEEFIQIVLDEEPDRYWLRFCLGMINHRAKADMIAARNDFTEFLRGADRNRFPRQVRAAQEWLGEIDKLLSDAGEPSSSASRAP